MPVGHLYIFFGEMSIQVFCPFFNWVVGFFAARLYKLILKHQFQAIISILKDVVSAQKIPLKDVLVAGGPMKLSVFSFACDDAAAGLWGTCFQGTVDGSFPSTASPL